MHLISIADEIALRSHAVDGRTNHQERPVELTSVERDESRIDIEPIPEFLEDLLLGSGDVRARTGLLDADIGLAGHLVERARAAVIDVDHADRNDASAKRRQSP